MVARLLVTTPMERARGDGRPVLLLGEWCRADVRDESWLGVDVEVLPYHWDDRVRLRADYLRVSEIYEGVLADLGRQLNTIHGVDHSPRYWRIVLGPWLGYFSQILLDRWESVQEAARRPDVSETIVVPRNDDAMVPRDMGDFYRLFHGDEWNHHIYAWLLEHCTSVRCVKADPSPRFDNGKSQPVARRGLRSAAIGWVSSLASRLAGSSDGFMIRTYLPTADALKLQAKLGQFPQHWRAPALTSPAPDAAKRGWTLPGGAATGFERALRALIPQQIPTVYLEGFARLQQAVDKARWPKHPRWIWTSASHHQDEVFKAWAAAAVERGAPLIIGQHGGHFGVGLWSFVEDHELAISDRYFSWGWTEPSAPHIVPVGQLKGKAPLRVDHATQPRALLVTCGLPRYSYWMYSIPVAGQFLEYLEDQYAFMEALPDHIAKKITVRLHPVGEWWSLKERVSRRLPWASIDEGARPISDQLARSRLCIATYNATTFLESFAMNVPTVMFWNPAHWELRDSAAPYFDALRAAGVFHVSPESAARHVAAIWDDAGGWWNSDTVRAAVRRFTSTFARSDSDVPRRIQSSLRALGA